MQSLLILEPLVPVAITVSRGSGVANLSTPDPKEVWLDSAVGTDAAILLDFGKLVTFDTVYVGSTNAVDAATWLVSYGPTNTTPTAFIARSAMAAPTFIGSTVRHAFTFQAAVTARYVRITMQQPNGSPPLTVGIVAVGQSFQPKYGREYGSGRGIIDTGNKERLRGGGFGIGLGARIPTWTFTMGDIQPDELKRLWGISLRAGETAPLLTVEDPDLGDDLAERLHWGIRAKVEAYERIDPSNTRIAFTVEDWI